MIKKCIFALSLLLCVSCVPVEAITPGAAIKNSLKTAGGAGLIALGLETIRVAVSTTERAKMQEEFLKARAELRELAKKGGADMAQFDAETFQLAKTVDTARVVAGIIGLGMTIGGLVLGYKGIMGFFTAPVAQVV